MWRYLFLKVKSCNITTVLYKFLQFNIFWYNFCNFLLRANSNITNFYFDSIHSNLNLDASSSEWRFPFGQAVMDEVALIGPCSGRGPTLFPTFSEYPLRPAVTLEALFFLRTRKEKKKLLRKLRKREFCISPDVLGVDHQYTWLTAACIYLYIFYRIFFYLLVINYVLCR